MNAQRIKLNLIPGGVPPIVHVSQYDVGRTLEFSLYDGVTAATVESGTAIDIRGTKPDKKGFSYPCEYAGNIITINTTRQMTAVAGSFDCELHLVKDTTEIGTANFILEVEPAALSDDTVISESEMPAIVEAARKNELTDESVQTLVDSASAAASSATAAANSATAAAASETNAADSASAANTSKTAAAGSASAAATSASNAASSASSASTSASSASQSAESAAASAQQALENVTGATVFNGSKAGLVPSTNISHGFLDANGQWNEKSWMNMYSFAERIIEGNTTPRALSKGDLFMRPNKSDGEWLLCRATTAIAANTELSYGNYEEISFQKLLSEMKTSFQNGVDTIRDALVAKGVTPTASTPTAIAAAIAQMVQPTGTLNITTEGTHNVASYAQANVNIAYQYDSVALDPKQSRTTDKAYKFFMYSQLNSSVDMSPYLFASNVATGRIYKDVPQGITFTNPRQAAGTAPGGYIGFY